MNAVPLPPEVVREDVRRALEEDVGGGDRTAHLVPREQELHTRVISRETAVLAGASWRS